jgi:integrase
VHLFPVVVFGGGQDSIGHIIVVKPSRKLGAGALVFRPPEGAILDPDNLYHRVFLPVLAKAGIREIRLHGLRHTFGSLLFQNGASIVYVKEEIGHSPIQVTVDMYGHLIPGANVCFFYRLDQVPPEPAETTRQQSAPPAQQGEMEIPPDLLQVVPGLD